jgi:hypothetical protein
VKVVIIIPHVDIYRIYFIIFTVEMKNDQTWKTGR